MSAKKEKKAKNKKKGEATRRQVVMLWVAGFAAVALIVGTVAAWFYFRVCGDEYAGSERVRVFIPANSTERSVRDSLESRLGSDFGGQVARLLSLSNANFSKATGSYVVSPGDEVKDVARKIRTGAQDPVKVTFNNIRTLPQLAARVSSRMCFSDSDFIAACDTVLTVRGYAAPEFPAAFLPDTYEFYWNESPAKVVGKLADVRERWWTPERRATAKALGLSETQVATLASIVEEETAKVDEKPMVARLYLNRLHDGMRLQADPTVKFAVGDFSLRRITGEHLGIDSPYNTYKHAGLPPGPIRIPEAATLQAVLNAPSHNYVYMCAKEDFSGYHNFAVTWDEHKANAQRYHAALDRRGIH